MVDNSKDAFTCRKESLSSFVKNKYRCVVTPLQLNRAFPLIWTLKEKDFCFNLQPKADHQGSKIPFSDYRWVGPYIVQKTLPNDIYIVRKINTNKTQILHRIRLNKFVPNEPILDSNQNEKLQADDDIIVPQDDLYTLAWENDFGNQLSEHSDTVSIPVSVRPQAHYTETADEAATTRICIESNPSNLNSSDVNDKSVRRAATRYNDVTSLTIETNEQQRVPDFS